MTRNDIQAVVLKYLARAVGTIDPSSVDTSRSMKELGANSLDMVEVVSSSMRELRIRIPRSELNKLHNLDGLIDLLHEVAQSQEAARA